MDMNDFVDALVSAPAGTSVEYHLARDPNMQVACVNDRVATAKAGKMLSDPGEDRICAVAKLAMDMQSAGRVALVQRRNGDRSMSYLAQRTRKF